MKYFILVLDGMADRKIPELNGRTPMEVANKPALDALAKVSRVGTVSNVPVGMVPESDTANLAILSYDPKVFSKGRSPLEAVSMGIKMQPDETAYRCNLVTLSNEEPYTEKIMLDHSADEISTEEADELIKALEEHFGDDQKTFYTGISYRHCLIWKNGNDHYDFARPHDIISRAITNYLPNDAEGKVFFDLMQKSYAILKDHPVNIKRREEGKNVANSAWFWSPGKKPQLPSFREKWGLDAAVISAVDLIKGIGLCADMQSIDVDGATGNVHTNYKGKADAAITAFRQGKDLVFLHVEAPDECGHRGEIANKVLSIEKIDQDILAPVLDHLRSTGEPFRVLALPDHPTPIEIRTHSMEPVPFLLYDSEKTLDGVETYTEATAEAKGDYIPDGTKLMSFLVDA